MSKYAVLGNPVSHSKSPLIHSLFAKQTEQVMSYSAIALEESEFDPFVIDFFEKGGGGLNVTIPFKGKAFALATSCSPRAEIAKAVNTLFVGSDGKICGDNTDGLGLVTDIKVNHGFAIRDRRVLILGAGGAVRGALAALVYQKTAGITVANRTLARAEQLVSEFGELAHLQAKPYEDIATGMSSDISYDLIINGTSLSLHSQAPPVNARLIAKDCCCYDLMYADTDTAFVQWAKKQGARLSVDGLGMLVEQAAESFALWRGIRPATAAIIAELRDSP